MKLTYLSLMGAEKLPFYEDKFWVFFSIGLDNSSILSHSFMFGFLDDKLEHKFLLDHIVLIFKSYLYKAREKKILNFNLDLEANLKDKKMVSKQQNDIMYRTIKIKTKSSKNMLPLIKLLVCFIYLFLC